MRRGLDIKTSEMPARILCQESRASLKSFKEREGENMFKHDDDGAMIGLIMGIAIILFIVYVIVLLATIIAGIAAAGGTVYGGGHAIKNYISSFKENVIDSNRASATAA